MVGFGGPFDFMFTIFQYIFLAIFLVAIGVIVTNMAKGAGQFRRNNTSPVLTVDCTVVGKRESMRRHHHRTGGDSMETAYNTTDYFITFEVASGDRIELEVNPQESGMIVEGDRGKLTFQGTRYKGFERSR